MLQCFGDQIVHLGPSGSGHLVKSVRSAYDLPTNQVSLAEPHLSWQVNNALLGAHVLLASEAGLGCRAGVQVVCVPVMPWGNLRCLGTFCGALSCFLPCGALWCHVLTMCQAMACLKRRGIELPAVLEELSAHIYPHPCHRHCAPPQAINASSPRPSTPPRAEAGRPCSAFRTLSSQARSTASPWACTART